MKASINGQQYQFEDVISVLGRLLFRGNRNPNDLSRRAFETERQLPDVPGGDRRKAVSGPGL